MTDRTYPSGEAEGAGSIRRRSGQNDALPGLASPAAQAMYGLVNALLPAYALLKALGTRATHHGQHLGIRYSFLRLLKEEGPCTIPRIANMRGVARQHMQKLSHGFAAEGYVTFLDNPKHKRSKLVALTPAGEAECARLEQNLIQEAESYSEGMDVEDIRSAEKVLAQLHKNLHRLLEQEN